MADRFDIATGKIPEPEKPQEPKRALETGIDTFGFSEIFTESRNKILVFRARADHPSNIALITSTAKPFIGARVHFHVDRRMYVLCNKGQCCKKLSKSGLRIGTVIFNYSQTQPISGRPDGIMQPWFFSERIYNYLCDINKQFPLNEHDMEISCDNERYQSINIRPQRSYRIGEYLRDNDFQNDIKLCEKFIREHIGSKLTDEELADDFEKITPTKVEQQVTNPAVSLLDDVLDSLDKP